jgi:general secretion pathway protein A
MYLQSFGLTKNPFSITSDPYVVFLSPGHREALAGLCYGMLDRKGLLVMLGQAGTGKTTLLGKAIQTVPPGRVEFAAVQNPTQSPSEFLESILLAFHILDVPASKPQRLLKLQARLLALQNERRIATLLLDEAHMLSKENLEEVRLLGNLENKGEKLLQIVLAGQEDLAAVMNRPDMAQLKQRVAVRLWLKPLSPIEVCEYVRHRWVSAGGVSTIPFSQAAMEQIARASHGIPRLVNVICDTSLLMACGEPSPLVEKRHVIESCSDLDLTDAAPEQKAPKPVQETVAPAPLAVSDVGMPTLLRYQAESEKRSFWARLAGRPRSEKENEKNGQSSKRIERSTGRTPGISAAVAD